MIIDPRTIRPKVRGHSDFFSWQLYRWACRRPHGCEVYAGTWNSISGIDITRRVMYIGGMEKVSDNEYWFHGKQLRALCSHGADLRGCAYGPAHDTANWENITSKFWADYMQRGVCAIHDDLAHEWEVTKPWERVCKYCGKREERKTAYTPVYVWEEVSA